MRSGKAARRELVEASAGGGEDTRLAGGKESLEENQKNLGGALFDTEEQYIRGLCGRSRLIVFRGQTENKVITEAKQGTGKKRT